MVIPNGVTMTLDSSLTIQGGSELIVQGELVNNLYKEDNDPDTNNVGVWNEDGALIIDGGSYRVPNGGYIYLTTNYGAYVDGIDSKLIFRNTYVYSEAELRNALALDIAPQYGYNQVMVWEDIVLSAGLTIPENALVVADGVHLNIGAGVELINNGTLEASGDGQILVLNNSKLANNGEIKLGYEFNGEISHGSMLVDAGGRFFNYGTLEQVCCDKALINNTVLVQTITASVGGNSKNPSVASGFEFQLDALVKPDNAHQKDVMWSVVKKDMDVEYTLDKYTGKMTVILPEEEDTATVTVRVTALDGSDVYDELAITVKNYKVEVAFGEHSYELDQNGNPILKFNQKITMKQSGESDKVTWKLLPGDEMYASLSVNKKTNEATLTAKTLSAKQTVTIIASAADGISEPAELKVTILPKAYGVYVFRNELDENGQTLRKNVTGQTLTFDIGDPNNQKTDGSFVTMDLSDVINPAETGTYVKWTEDSKGKIATLKEDGTVIFTGKTGTVKITATAQDGSKAVGSVTIKVVDLIQKIEIVDKTNELIGGKSFTFTAFELENGETVGKKLDKSKVKWSLAEEDAPYAKIDAGSGKLTTQKVPEKVTITVTAEVIGNENKSVSVVNEVTIYPLTTQVEILHSGNKVNDTTIKLDLKERTSLQLGAKVYPDDVMPDMIKWSIAKTKVAEIDEKTGKLTVLNDKNGNPMTGTVTITAEAQDGSGKKATVKVQIGTFAEAVTITTEDKTVIRSGDKKALTLSADVYPENTTVSGVVWSLVNAEDSAYVTLDAAKGTLKAKTVYDEHEVKVIATSKDGNAVSEEPITVVVKPAKDGILTLLNESRENVTGITYLMDMQDENRELVLSAYTLGYEDEIEDVSWKTSDKKIATVTENADGTATVKVLKTGTVTITATHDDKRTAKITIKATKLVHELVIDSKTGDFIVASGKTLNLTATAFPTDASSKSVTWSMAPGSEEFASIDKNGKLTAKANLTKEETVTVVATAKDGSGISVEQEIRIQPLVQGLDIWMDGPGVLTNTTLVWDMVETPVLKLSAETYPESAGDGITWKSSNTKIATIDAEGMVTCKKAGTVTITATASDGSGKKVTFKLTVVKKMTSLALADQVIAGGKSLDLSKLVEILEKDTTNKKLTWSISGDGSDTDGTAFATLSSSGKLTTKTVTSTKKVTITVAATDDSGLVATCEVTIRPATTKVSIYDGDVLVNGKTITLGVGEEPIELWAENAPDGATQAWTWSSNNKAVTVENGVVTAVTAGKTVTITAKATDGSGKSATVKIKTINRMTGLELPEWSTVASTKSITLKPAIEPANTTTKTLKWSITSGSEFASIDKNGKLKAKKLNNNEPVMVQVMAVSTDGSDLTAFADVEILPLTTKVHVWNEEIGEVTKTQTMYVDEGQMTLWATSDPENALQAYKWSVSNKGKDVAIVDDDETDAFVYLEAINPGKTATITAAATDGSGKKASFKVTTLQRMQELTLDETAVLGEGKSLTLKAGIAPSNTSSKNLTWELLDENGDPIPGNQNNLVKLSSKGVLTSKANTIDDSATATAIVRVSSKDGSELSAVCVVTIHSLTKAVQIADAGEVEITKTIKLNVGDSLDLNAFGYINSKDYSDPVNKFAADDFNWTTSGNTYVSFVEDEGDGETILKSTSGNSVTVKALKPGKTITITAAAKDGSGKKDQIKIQTLQPVTGITFQALPGESTTDDVVVAGVVNPGKSITLKPKIEPSNASDKKLAWEILDDGEDYASIDKNGKLTAKKGIEGMHTIMVQVSSTGNYEVENKVAICKVVIGQKTTSLTLWNGDNNVTGKTENLYMGYNLIFSGQSNENTYDQYTWKVSDSKSACFIDENGNQVSTITGGKVELAAKKAGKTVTITVTANDGSGKKVTFKVKTMKPVTELVVNDTVVFGGKFISLSVAEITKDASNKKVRWDILDENGMIVESKQNEYGKLYGNYFYAEKTAEEVTITLRATAEDGQGAVCDFTITIQP